MKFQKFDKIPRLSRDIIISEKIDGTNAQIFIISRSDLALYGAEENDPDFAKERSFVSNYCLFEKDDVYVFAGSRKRWLDCSSKGDNFGFAKWVKENAEELLKLGEGKHFGEWYGQGIQSNYGLDEKRFALFNVGKWNDETKPDCCEVVPVLYEGMFDTTMIETVLYCLERDGSKAVSGFMKPEGIIIYHQASGKLFKKTIKNDEKPKGLK